MENKQNFVITIGREFGSGGREIGKRLSEILSIDYYDKELLAAAAKESGVSTHFFEKSDERSPSFFENIHSYNLGLGISSYVGVSTPISHNNIYTIQSRVIEKIADEKSCIIVGRTADYILRNHPCCINIFLHSDMSKRVSRIMKRGDVTSESDAIAIALKRDKLRAAYYNYYTDKTWGQAASYDLSIDTSTLSIDEAVKLIADYAKIRINQVYGAIAKS
ncbi:MAG: cytidylate kinase-like family protein [Muribaculaceae bacterium]|nr:cytidylate kinase-like family protein [Muribaculaceae bacterium]